MEVSMDGLRKRLISDYNSLTRKLNKNTFDKKSCPEIVIDPEEISKEMEGLRQGLVALAFCYLDGEFEALDENTHFENFSEKE